MIHQDAVDVLFDLTGQSHAALPANVEASPHKQGIGLRTMGDTVMMSASYDRMFPSWLALLIITRAQPLW